MDPVSLAFGTASLAIQLFDGVVKGFDIFEVAVGADSECEAYKLRLRIEYDKLVRWGEASGLLAQENDARSMYDQKIKNNGNLVIAMLSQLQLLLQDLRRSELKWEFLKPDGTVKAALPDVDRASATASQDNYPKAGDLTEPGKSVSRQKPDKHVVASHDLKPDAIKGQRAMLQSVVNIQDSPRGAVKYPRGLDRLKSLAIGAIKVTKQPKRFIWAVRAGGQFDSKLRKVEHLVRSLEEMLSQEQLAVILQSTNDFKLDLLQLATNVGQMKALLESQDTRRSIWEGSTLVDAPSIMTNVPSSIQQAESRFTAFLNAAIQFSIDMNGPQPVASGSLELGPSDVESLRVGDVAKCEVRTWVRTSTSSFKWIEWKNYTPPDPLERIPSSDTLNRARRLVMLLRAKKKPSEFCVPECMGFFVDRSKTRIGVVFDAPHTPDKKAVAPRSLLGRFGERAASLPTRISMAQRLSQWLLYLHAVNWLHKGLRSANVLLVESSGDDDKLLVSGFEYSRLSKGEHTSTGPSSSDESLAWYVHPDYLGSRRNLGFRKTYDMYSLGIVLIELAYWKPIQTVYAEAMARTDSSQEARAGAERAFGEAARNTSAAGPSISDIERLRARMLQPESDPELDILSRLKETVGLRYYRATRACIQGMSAFGLDDKLEQTDPTVGAHLQRAFVEVVVDCLKGIVV